tara:strand:+ start:571 stop:1476 length:906 start_codon:yes stop_codon:yes gene_type:complete
MRHYIRKTLILALLFCPTLLFAGDSKDNETAVGEAGVKFGIDAADGKTVLTSGCIKAVPEPCSTTIDAAVERCDIASFVEINMTATITYSQFGRNDVSTISRRWTGNKCAVKLAWPLSDEVLDGKYSMRASYRLSNGQTGNGNRSGEAKGENPSSDAVRQRVGNLSHSVILYKRNKFKQFNQNARPFRRDGIGAGGIETPSSEQFWNWHSSVDQAVSELDLLYTEAKKYPELLRSKGFASLPDFTADQIKLQAIQSVVAQSYFVPLRNGKGWKPMTDRLLFADDVLSMELDIQSGNPPQGW